MKYNLDGLLESIFSKLELKTLGTQLSSINPNFPRGIFMDLIARAYLAGVGNKYGIDLEDEDFDKLKYNIVNSMKKELSNYKNE